MRPHRQQPNQASPSLGFSRQEHWSRLPFPSPMRESEVAQSCPTLSDPMDCSLPVSSIHGIFQARVLEWGAIAFSGEAPCWVIIIVLFLVCVCVLFFFLRGNFLLFSLVAVSIYSLPTMQEVSFSLLPLQHLLFVDFFDGGHPADTR